MQKAKITIENRFKGNSINRKAFKKQDTYKNDLQQKFHNNFRNFQYVALKQFFKQKNYSKKEQSYLLISKEYKLTACVDYQFENSFQQISFIGFLELKTACFVS
ncbi:hypothetical protein ABPG72_010685 [Tetrahymena utriculariae]